MGICVLNKEKDFVIKDCLLKYNYTETCVEIFYNNFREFFKNMQIYSPECKFLKCSFLFLKRNHLAILKINVYKLLFNTLIAYV